MVSSCHDTEMEICYNGQDGLTDLVTQQWLLFWRSLKLKQQRQRENAKCNERDKDIKEEGQAIWRSKGEIK